MPTHTVRLDPDSESLLRELQKETGDSVSAVLKQGLVALRESLRSQAAGDPYSVYEAIDLGPGGYARGAAHDAKKRIRAVLADKRSPR